MNLQNTNETVSLNAKDKIPRGLNSYDLSRTDNIANNVSNVNNTETKFLVMLILIVDTIFLMR